MAVTFTLLRTVVAFAAQTSAVPAWVLARARRRQVKLPPLTFEKLCEPPAEDPSEETKASTSSPADDVVSAGELMLVEALV